MSFAFCAEVDVNFLLGEYNARVSGVASPTAAFSKGAVGMTLSFSLSTLVELLESSTEASYRLACEASPCLLGSAVLHVDAVTDVCF